MLYSEMMLTFWAGVRWGFVDVQFCTKWTRAVVKSYLCRLHACFFISTETWFKLEIQH